MGTQTVSMEDQLKELNASVKKLLAENPEYAAYASEQAKPEEPKPYRSETLRCEFGAAIRGSIRRQLALKTDLEVKEIKGFFESVFIITAHSPKQSTQLRAVHAWLKRIASDD